MSVHIYQTGCAPGLGGLVDDCVFGRGQMRQLVSRVKFGDVPGTVSTQIVANPLGNAGQFFDVIVFGRNHIGARLDMDAELGGATNRAKHLVDRADRTDVVIELGRQALDIGTQHVDVRRHQFERLIGDEAVGNVNSEQPRLVRQFRHVEHIFKPHRRF